MKIENGKLLVSSGINYIDNRFRGDLRLKEVVLPEGVVEIEPYAFEGCANLETVVLPQSLKAIPDGLFARCSKLNSVEMEKGIESVGEDSFAYCRELSSIILPDGVKEIWLKAFTGLSGTTIFIPESVETVESWAVYDCVTVRVYCEAEKRPDGWSKDWCPDQENPDRFVHIYWGYSVWEYLAKS